MQKHDADELLRARKNILNELELSESDLGVEADTGSLIELFSGFSNLDMGRRTEAALDVAIFLGLSGDWASALEWVNLGALGLKPNSSLDLWRLRCLVELERYAEALALVDSGLWSVENLLHVNYLAGISCRGLGMVDQAQVRFRSVKNVDASYRDIEALLIVE